MSALGAAQVARASTSTIITSIVTDPLTGVALDAFDPVSFFTEGQAIKGSAEYAYVWGGVPWYFFSAANRDIFAKSPDVYAPMYGGYGTMSLARGYLSAGNPRIFEVLAGRLFVFYSSGNRDAFMLSPRSAFKDAERNWVKLSKNLIKS